MHLRLLGLGLLVTACNSSCGKVMFSQACVKNSVHGGRGCLPLVRGDAHPLGRHSPGRHPLGRHPPGRHPHLGRHPPGQTPSEHYGIWSTSGRYASYWNVFLLSLLWEGSLTINSASLVMIQTFNSAMLVCKS